MFGINTITAAAWASGEALPNCFKRIHVKFWNSNSISYSGGGLPPGSRNYISLKNYDGSSWTRHLQYEYSKTFMQVVDVVLKQTAAGSGGYGGGPPEHLLHYRRILMDQVGLLNQTPCEQLLDMQEFWKEHRQLL